LGKSAIRIWFGTNNTDQVTVSVATGPGGLTAGSTTTVTVSAGAASFGNLVFNAAGIYTLDALSTSGLTVPSLTLHVARNGLQPTWLPQVAHDLTHSAEYYTGVITAAYDRYLGRPSDAGGLASWLAQMQNGLTDEHLEAGFIGSGEYIQSHGGAGAGWVRGMYEDLLGRTPSQAEVNSWLQVLASGESTIEVAYGFAASGEREGNRAPAGGAGKPLERGLVNGVSRLRRAVYGVNTPRSPEKAHDRLAIK
jgi:hypothetical protein